MLKPTDIQENKENKETSKQTFMELTNKHIHKNYGNIIQRFEEVETIRPSKLTNY